MMVNNYDWLDQHLLSLKGVERDYKEEWGWYRYQVGNKLFAAICKDANGDRDLLTIKLAPEEGAFLREQYEDIFPGYYMNKLHWNSIYLNGKVSKEMMLDLADKSYSLIFHGLTKKLQKSIIGEDSEK